MQYPFVKKTNTELKQVVTDLLNTDETCGQSQKASTSVNCDSRNVNICSLLVNTTLES